MLYYLDILWKGSTNTMSIKEFIKKTLVRSCVYFTCIMVLYIAISAMINVTDDSTIFINAGRTILFFVFALLLSLSNSLLSLDKMSMAIRVLLHYIITAFAFYACFMLIQSMRSSEVLVGLVIYTVVYAVIMGIIAAFKSRYRTNLEKSERYYKQYSKTQK